MPTAEEQDNEALMDTLQAQYQQYREKKYRVAVFCSGRGNLTGLTEELLLHNRVVAIRKEPEQEMSMKFGM